jgi:TonB family protein
MTANKQNKNILRVALGLSVVLHLAGFYFLFPLESSSQEKNKSIKVKVLYQQAKKFPAKKTPAVKSVPSNTKSDSPAPVQQSYFPVKQKEHPSLPEQLSPSFNVRAPQQIASFKEMSPLQKIIRQEKVAKANTQFATKSPVDIEVRPQSAKRLQIASLTSQAVSQQIQPSTPKTIQSHEPLKMSIANSKPDPVKENVHAQLKSPRPNSVGEIFRTAQAVHQASKAVSARKEIRQRSLEKISPASHYPTPIKSAKSSAPGATISLRHPTKQFPSPSKGKESAVSPQKTSGEISLKLARLFPTELREQQNVIQGKSAEVIHPGALSSAALNPALDSNSNPQSGADSEPSKSLNRGENPSDSPGNDSGEIHRVFSAQIWGKIAKQKYYPRVARKRGYQGKPVVSFTISETGDLRDLVLLQPSSHKILDEAALTAVKNASPV